MTMIDRIKSAVALEFNIGLTDMTNTKRFRRVARPRQVAMYLTRELTKRSLPEIGRSFGNRDHTTVMHAVSRIAKLVAEDEDFRERVEAVRGGVGGGGGGMRPLAIDLFCGLGGWTEGLLAEGYDVVGFDIERHVYGDHRYPAQLVLQDILTVHGSQFKDAALIVASPPCQEYSYMAMPWSLAKAKARAIREDTSGQALADLNRLFDACFRIQAQASLAAGHHIPMVVENVRGAIPWVGRSRWNFGSFHLWGDVPALMPSTLRGTKVPGLKNGCFPPGGLAQGAIDGQKVPGFRFDGSGGSFQSASVETTGRKSHGMNWSDRTIKGQDFTRIAGRQAEWTTGPLVEGRKGVNGRSSIRNREADARPSHGNGLRRKAASAMIAKIPLPLSRHIAATFHPEPRRAAA